MNRSEQNEEKFSEARKLAWDFVLPYKFIPILDNEYDQVNNLTKFLEPILAERDKYKQELENLRKGYTMSNEITASTFSNNEIRQVIVVRKDLNMRKGKIAAQAAHASCSIMKQYLMAFKKTRIRADEEDSISYESCYFNDEDDVFLQWINGVFTKIVVGCDSEKELLDIYNKAQEINIARSLITDAGLTEFNGVPTNTCICLGPHYKNVIDPLTGHLKLL